MKPAIEWQIKIVQILLACVLAALLFIVGYQFRSVADQQAATHMAQRGPSPFIAPLFGPSTNPPLFRPVPVPK